MASPKADLSARFIVAVLVLALLLLGSMVVVLWAGGKLRWDTQLFARSHEWLSIPFLLAAGFAFLRGVRGPEWDAFAPLRIFYTLWFALLAVGCLQLTNLDTAFTLRFWTTVTSGLVAFYLGALLARRAAGKNAEVALSKMPSQWRIEWVPSRALLVAGIFSTICLAAFLYEYLHSGIIPLLADDPDSVRFKFSVNSYVNRFAVSFYLVAQLGYIGIAHIRKYRAAFLGMILMGVVAISLLTARFFLVLAVWMAIVLFHYGRRRMTPRVAILVVLLAYPLAKLAVDVKRFHANPTFNRILDQLDFPENLRAFAPDYLYFSTTLQTLDHMTFIIPKEISYQYGWYTAYPIRVFWTPRQGEGFRGRLDDLFWERSYEWSAIPAVTAGYMGVPYADFGIPGVFVFSCILGWLCVRVYESMRRQPTFWRAFLYSQLSFAVVLSIYGNYLTLFEFYWNLAVMGLVHRLASDRSRSTSERTTVPGTWTLNTQAHAPS